MSKVIKKELETFETARVKDFKKTIVKYLESLLSHQQEVRDTKTILAHQSLKLGFSLGSLKKSD